MENEQGIYASYDDEGVFVYQAFTPETVEAALAKGTFGKGFNMDRMTWIKPSFAWMLYRSGYATKTRQQAILKIKLTHEGFLTILRESIETSYKRDIFEDIDDWRRQLKQSKVRHQWDPERYLTLGKHPTRRAIQIGIRDWLVEKYVNQWIIGLEEVTSLAKSVQDAKINSLPFPAVPDEQIYRVDEELINRLGITGGNEDE